MGYIVHHAIIITGWKEDEVKKVHDYAKSLYVETAVNGEVSIVSEIVGSYVNGYTSFAIMPDGSKEGWSDSDKGDNLRESIKAYLFENKLWGVNWVEVSFGGDQGAALIEDSSHNHTEDGEELYDN